jgi:hypothetical protein
MLNLHAFGCQSIRRLTFLFHAYAIIFNNRIKANEMSSWKNASGWGRVEHPCRGLQGVSRKFLVCHSTGYLKATVGGQL